MNGSATICISEAQLRELVAARVAELLTPEVVAEIARGRIDERIGRLTLKEAMPRLGCSNERQLKDKCRHLGIAVRKDLGQKCQYILLADIEARGTSKSLLVALQDSQRGTRIGRVDGGEERKGSAAA